MTESNSPIEAIEPRQFQEAEGVEDWRILGDGACAFFRTGTFAAGARLVQSISELARQISAAARELGLPAAPSVLQNVQLSIDSRVGPEVLPFGRAVLDYQARGDEPGDLIDPRARGPLVYAQRWDESHPRHRRIHLDVSVAHDQAEARIAAAVAAGGRLVTDADAPSWTTLEDTEGNLVCVCTWRSTDSEG